MTGKLVSIETTQGSPFGHQWWTIEVEGKAQRFAMWEDWSQWPARGTTVTIEETGQQECHTGYNSKIMLRPCARLVGCEKG